LLLFININKYVASFKGRMNYIAFAQIAINISTIAVSHPRSLYLLI